ncbi:hypothetical protein [Brevibacterium epidermidis]|uniref:hypothetical protein n=1 Tax=Brevibacterium epidermidis TaxID=1698 RepID=UPI000BF2B20F|nr:hypothetical protein [Brevibacterium epidermidis]
MMYLVRTTCPHQPSTPAAPIVLAAVRTALGVIARGSEHDETAVIESIDPDGALLAVITDVELAPDAVLEGADILLSKIPNTHPDYEAAQGDFEVAVRIERSE